MRSPDRMSVAGIREWGMCHILFKQPDAVVVVVEGSQLLLSLSSQFMLLGRPPPAGKVPSGYHSDDWHPCFAEQETEVI